jgi:hypothetical protein
VPRLPPDAAGACCGPCICSKTSHYRFKGRHRRFRHAARRQRFYPSPLPRWRRRGMMPIPFDSKRKRPGRGVRGEFYDMRDLIHSADSIKACLPPFLGSRWGKVQVFRWRG